MLVTKQKVLRRFWYPVIPASHLEDGPKPFTLLGERIVVWQDGERRVSALEDRCCHRTAALSRGFYDQGQLVCGYHGWTYDHTGKCVRIPQFARNTVPEGARVPAYQAELRYGYVWVCLDEQPVLGIPEIEEWDDPRLRRIPQFYEVWKCAGLRLMENSFDNAHVNFVHRGTFGDPRDAGETNLEFFDEPYGFRMKTEFPVKQTELAAKMNRIDGGKTVRRIESSWFMPFARRLRISYPSGLLHVLITVATPIDDASSQIVQFCIRSDREEDVSAADAIAFDRKVTEEDKYILESTDPDVPLSDGGWERNMASDKPGILMRRRLLALLRQHGEDEVHARAPRADPPASPGVRAA
jgi:phenylpropionate dioxygenase-like ring-hydroxylating dioxygenase large terminal subunit